MRSRSQWVREHGRDPIAYATLQPGMQYFDPDAGYVAFRRVGGIDVTLGGPVCAADDRAAILHDFLKQARRPVLHYLDAATAAMLADSKLHIAGMGLDRYVDLEALTHSPSKVVRGASKKAARAGLRITERSFDTLCDAERRRIDEVSEGFFDAAQCSKEMTFINCPMGFEADGMRRLFLIEKFDAEHQGLFGYLTLNPYFEAGQVRGFLLDMLRFEPTKLWGVWFSIVSRVAELIAAEGKELCLGFCPLHGVTKAPVRSSAVLDRQMAWLVRYLSNAQYVRRLREMKDEIPGATRPRFFASYSRLAWAPFAGLVRASGLRFGGLLSPELLSSIAAGLRKPEVAEVQT